MFKHDRQTIKRDDKEKKSTENVPEVKLCIKIMQQNSLFITTKIVF